MFTSFAMGLMQRRNGQRRRNLCPFVGAAHDPYRSAMLRRNVPDQGEAQAHAAYGA